MSESWEGVARAGVFRPAKGSQAPVTGPVQPGYRGPPANLPSGNRDGIPAEFMPFLGDPQRVR
jgi:hypothetical protein